MDEFSPENQAAPSPDQAGSLAPPLPIQPILLEYCGGYATTIGKPGKHRILRWYFVGSCVLLGLGVVSEIAQMPEQIATLRAAVSSSPSVVSLQPGPKVLVASKPGVISLVDGVNGVIALVLGIYMLVWIYQVHKEMRDYTGGHYPISPGKALGFCFIPLYSIYWTCYVPYKLAKELEAYLGAGAIRPKRVLLLLVLTVVPGMLISGFGPVFYAIVLLWIQRSLNDLWKGVRAAGPNSQAVAGLNAMVAS